MRVIERQGLSRTKFGLATFGCLSSPTSFQEITHLEHEFSSGMGLFGAGFALFRHSLLLSANFALLSAGFVLCGAGFAQKGDKREKFKFSGNPL